MGLIRAFCFFLLAGSPVFLISAGEEIDFNREIRPLLSSNCFACHGPDEAERKADLRLDTEEGSRIDLGGYAAIVPGKPEASELLHRLLSEDDDEVMPPPKHSQRFSLEQTELIRRWIEQGAKYELHWSYAAPVKGEVPEVGDKEWPLNEIDHFLLARLEAEDLKPSPEASRETLARRLALDLTGLPPSWEEVRAFVEDESPKAYESYVEAQLAKPAFGEHWAQSWLDLARYADSSGYPSDQPREIWGYRDWVVKAFNQNLPFDQFTIEQIAGDLLPQASEEQLIATAFHRNTMTQNEGGTNDEEFRIAAVIDRVNTTMAVWMGTTMSCAQCHTHKYDPITHHDYFSLYAILNQSADADRKDETPVFAYFTEEQKAGRARLKAEIEEREKRFASPEPTWLSGFEAWKALFSREPIWNYPQPEKLSTNVAGEPSLDEKGWATIGKRAERATYTVDLPLTSGALTALRLETAPAEGFSNFVLTRLRAELVPAGKAGVPEARYVRIELPGKERILHLAEVEVRRGEVNLARSGKARQSSQYANAAASLAVDGKRSGNYRDGSVAHTETEDHPWWEVDLGSEQPIDVIEIWNRTDPNTDTRLNGFRVVALDAQREPVWMEEGIEAPKEKISFDLARPRQVQFAKAQADYEQKGFPADSLLLAASDEQAKGWAIAGATDRPHQLTMLLETAMVTKGSRLRITLEQQSRYPQHVIGRFRLGVMEGAQIADFLEIPAEVLSALEKPEVARSVAEQKVLRDYYLRWLAPELAQERAQLAAATKALAGIKEITVPVMEELPESERRETRIQLRGNWQNLGEVVEPGVPDIFHPLPNGAKPNRLGLAHWLIDRENPLTARVIVNRYWESLFGIGLVRTSEEFGAQGDLPSHPELLDWLAVDFMEHGWDVKRLLTQLVMTRTYRQDSVVSEEKQERDPDNRLLARGPRFRPTGELLRDQALAVAGILSQKRGGPPVRPMAPSLGLSTAFGRSNDWVTSEGEDRHRRSLYTEVRRNGPYASFVTFDATNREVCTIRRGRTNTPLQAFVTLNDPVFVETHQALARRLVREVESREPAAKVRQAYRIALSREADVSEVATLTQLYEEALATFRDDLEEARKMATEPLGEVPEGADLADLAAWTVTANVIMNLDEFIMRR